MRKLVRVTKEFMYATKDERLSHIMEMFKEGWKMGSSDPIMLDVKPKYYARLTKDYIKKVRWDVRADIDDCIFEFSFWIDEGVCIHEFLKHHHEEVFRESGEYVEDICIADFSYVAERHIPEKVENK